MKDLALLLAACACAITVRAGDAPGVTWSAGTVRIDFEGTVPASLGSPELIVADLAPGMMGKTHQAVYRTEKLLRIALRDEAFPVRAGTDDCLESSVRIYGFGRERPSDAELRMEFGDASADGGVSLRIVRNEDGKSVSCRLYERRADGKDRELGSLAFPVKALPADFRLVAAGDGNVRVVAESVADSVAKGMRPVMTAFFKGRTRPVKAHLELLPRKGPAEITIDDYSVGIPPPPPVYCDASMMKLERLPEFDPVAAGWPLVFEDDFNGAVLDSNKWYHSYGSDPRRAYVKDGVLHFACDWKAEKDWVSSAYLATKEKWAFGYYEARVKFTRLPGWWAAFWLCTEVRSNPFRDGNEIDIFEDYYTRRALNSPRGTPSLDFTYYSFLGTLGNRAWRYLLELTEEGLGEWHTIACRWTPFETSYYFDGKIIPSKADNKPHDTVTFDAANAGSTIVPLRVYIGGQIMPKVANWGIPNNPKDYPMPLEEYLVDRVRVYGYPMEGFPSVTLDCDDDRTFVREGDTFRFRAKATRGRDGEAIRAVYLYDSGMLLDVKTEPPYDFDVVFDNAHYRNTRYMRASGAPVPPLAKSGLHAYAAFVQDEKGRVAHSRVISKTMADWSRSTPFRGTAAKIPGRILAGRFDEGGQGVAYFDTTHGNAFKAQGWRTGEDVDTTSENLIDMGKAADGEWLVYTADVARDGEYRVTLDCTLNDMCVRPGMELYVDGTHLGTFKVGANGEKGRLAVTLDGIRLPSGRHRIVVMFNERFTFHGLRFEAKTQ